MTDILPLRAARNSLAAALPPQQATLDDLQSELDNAAGDGLPPPALAALRAQVLRQWRLVQHMQAELAAAQSAYQAAALADPMHQADPGLPLVLLPVRIETAYLPGAAGADLVVRVYPDDIHVDTHEPELTAAELAAGTAYWEAVWGAGPDTARLDAAWQVVLAQVKPTRAAWAAEALRPSAPRPANETPPDQPQPVPPLPAVAMRPDTFTRPPRTALLPDHWHVIGLRGGQELFNVDGAPIPDGLDVGFGPPGTGGASSDLPFGDGSRWLVDLDAAIAVGMAVRIPMAGPDLRVDQLFVLGVNAAVASADAAQRMDAALRAHQYTKGLGFLPPGTPTNNTEATRSAWSSKPLPPSPAEVEAARAAYLPGSNQNAAKLATALGIDGTDVLGIGPEALTDQQSIIASMQQVFWPALGGQALYMLFEQWDIPPGDTPSQGGWRLHADTATAAMLAQHAAGWVRSRGTLPVLRTGQQPYGVLPTSSLADWVPAADDPTSTILPWLRTFRDYWLAATGNVDRILPGTNPDAAMLGIMGRLPVSGQVMVRPDGDPVSQIVESQSFPVAPVPGLPSGSALFLSAPSAAAAPLPIAVMGDPVADYGEMQRWQGLFTDSIAVLTGAMPPQEWLTKYQPLIGQTDFPNAPPADLFTTMLHDALNDPLASDQISPIGLAILGAFFYVAKQNDPTFLAQLPGIVAGAQAWLVPFNALFGFAPALPQPATQPYEAAFREMLDVFSHRFDAWVTSLFARRLDAMRAAQPTGLVIGAYGWIENLAPRTDLALAAPQPAGFTDAQSSSLQRYVHAPSLHHAATAAVLRAGYESHGESGPLAVNLVSRRVRIADWLAEGVRNGQTVGALLGYRFERGLHEAQLDALIAPLRNLFPQPLLPGESSDPNDPARAAIAARNVVDGLALCRASASVQAQFPDPNVARLLADLSDALDALGDLLLAESVHHLVGGNPLRAGMAADTIGRGDPVPDRFDVVRTPRSGRPLTWQAGALLPAAFQAAAAGWATDRPRSVIAPQLEAWAETLLGDAASWRLACTLTTAEGEATTTVGLDTLALGALDVILEGGGAPSLLERRVIDAVMAARPDATAVTVAQAPAADGGLGFGELLGLAARLRSLLATADPLSAQHLEGPGTAPETGFDTGEFAARCAALLASFNAAVTQLATAAQALAAGAGDAAALRAALVEVADHGVASAYPGDAAGLGAQAAAVLAAATPLAATVLPRVPAAAAEVAAWIAATRAAVGAIVGRALPVIGMVTLPPGSAFASAPAPAGADAPAIMAWLRRVARTRPRAAALHDALLAAGALSGGPPPLAAAQLPGAAGATWAALPSPGAPITARLATVMSAPAPVDLTAPLCGIVADVWTEQVPGLVAVASRETGYEPAEVTGLAFTVSAPEAYPPQAILLALAPDPSWGWSLDVLLDVVRETLEMAKIRAVDLGDLPRLGRVLPALHGGNALNNVLAKAGMST